MIGACFRVRYSRLLCLLLFLLLTLKQSLVLELDELFVLLDPDLPLLDLDKRPLLFRCNPLDLLERCE